MRSGTGAVIPGLFAAGEAAGGVMGPRYVGGGNSISNAIVFGRLAGRAAAAEPGRSAQLPLTGDEKLRTRTRIQSKA